MACFLNMPGDANRARAPGSKELARGVDQGMRMSGFLREAFLRFGDRLTALRHVRDSSRPARTVAWHTFVRVYQERCLILFGTSSALRPVRSRS